MMEHLKTRWAALAAAILIALMPAQAATANPITGKDGDSELAGSAWTTTQADSDIAAAQAGTETADSGRFGSETAGSTRAGSETAGSTRAGGETASSEPAIVTEEANLRTGPTTSAPVEAILAVGTAVTVVCWADGDTATINGETSPMWLYVSRGGWLHSLLTTPVDVPPCGAGSSVLYENCDEARDAGAAPVRLGEAGYGLHLDRDRDGIGCEWDS